MYDTGPTRLIMIALAVLWLPFGRPGILPSVLMLTGGMNMTSTQVPGKYSCRQTLVFLCRAWPGRADVALSVGYFYYE